MQWKLDVEEVAVLAVEGVVTTGSVAISIPAKTLLVGRLNSPSRTTTTAVIMAVHICEAINARTVAVLVVAHLGKVTEVVVLAAEVLTSECVLIHLVPTLVPAIGVVTQTM
jgi:hypothetical protein